MSLAEVVAHGEKGDTNALQNLFACIYPSLIQAVNNNDIKIVRCFIKQKADIHDQNDKSLRVACRNGYTDIVKLLLYAKANIHADYDASLRSACSSGHADIARLLIEAKADVHAQNDYSLRRAVADGYIDIVKLLIENKANVRVNNDESLIVATRNGRINIVKALLIAKANISKLSYDFVHHYMNMCIADEDLSYLLDLEASGIDLSRVPNFNYIGYQHVKMLINSEISKQLGIYVSKIVMSYV